MSYHHRLLLLLLLLLDLVNKQKSMYPFYMHPQQQQQQQTKQGTMNYYELFPYFMMFWLVVVHLFLFGVGVWLTLLKMINNSNARTGNNPNAQAAASNNNPNAQAAAEGNWGCGWQGPMPFESQTFDFANQCPVTKRGFMELIFTQEQLQSIGYDPNMLEDQDFFKSLLADYNKKSKIGSLFKRLTSLGWQGIPLRLSGGPYKINSIRKFEYQKTLLLLLCGASNIEYRDGDKLEFATDQNGDTIEKRFVGNPKRAIFYYKSIGGAPEKYVDEYKNRVDEQGIRIAATVFAATVSKYLDEHGNLVDGEGNAITQEAI